LWPQLGHAVNALFALPNLYFVATTGTAMNNRTIDLLQQRTSHSELIKIRCTPDLKIRLARTAIARESDLSTIARDAFRFYLAQHELQPTAGR
jgi:hypothetical protein